jgi:N-acetylglucosaminyldiphosphoundecaprenol N-acetyl-beta-D-mannosaminyltransferase
MVMPRDLPFEPRASWRDVLRGRARLVGSRTLVGRRDLKLDPGLVSPYELRVAAGLHYGDPPIEEARYQRDRTLRSDAKTLARFLLTRAFPASDAPAPSGRHHVVSAAIDSCNTGEAVQTILAWLRERRGAVVFFVHPHALNLAARGTQLRDDLASADLVLPDGIGIRVAALVLGLSLPANVNGTDLIPEVLLELAANDIPIALIGGKPGVAERALEHWRKRAPLRSLGTWDGYQPERVYEEAASYLEANAPCLVLLAFGSPLQERFAIRHFRKRSGVVAVTVGGLFDFAAGDVPRAPLAWRELGLEWVWRLLQEPHRLGPRYLLGNPAFMARAVWQRARSGGVGRG